MSSKSGQILSSRQRILQLSGHLSDCSTQALCYARCVSSKEHVSKGDCAKEFQDLKTCIQNSVKKVKR